MNITTVKLKENGYLVNGQYNVPNSPSNRHYQQVQEWITEGNTPEPEFSGAELIANAKRDKLQELKAEGMSRITAEIAGIKDWDTLDLVREQWLSLAPAARNATPAFQKTIDIFQAGKDSVTAINALSDVGTIDAYDVVNTPAWPV